VTVSASIGIAAYPYDAAGVETLINHADSAMYAAKHRGKNRYTFYSETTDAGRSGKSCPAEL
jgi:diguanylate cyclase (GGDEF)-like protein